MDEFRNENNACMQKFQVEMWLEIMATPSMCN